MDPDTMMLDLLRGINEFQTHDIRLSMEDYKIFEVKCNIIPLSSLPAEATAPIHETEFDEITPQSNRLNNFKYRIAGVMQPRDLVEIQKIEN